MDYAFAARRGAHRGQRADLKWTKTEPSEPVFSTAIRLRRCRTWSTWTTKRLITHQYFPAGWNTSRNCSREVVDGELRRWRTELEQLRGNVRTPTRLGITTRATGEPKERRCEALALEGPPDAGVTIGEAKGRQVVSARASRSVARGCAVRHSREWGGCFVRRYLFSAGSGGGLKATPFQSARIFR